MSRLTFNTDEGEYSFENEELITHLEYNGYVVLGDGVNSLDSIDSRRLEEIQEKFINGSWDDRITLYNKIFNL